MGPRMERGCSSIGMKAALSSECAKLILWINSPYIFRTPSHNIRLHFGALESSFHKVGQTKSYY